MVKNSLFRFHYCLLVVLIALLGIALPIKPTKAEEDCQQLECLAWLAGDWYGVGKDLDGNIEAQSWHAWSDPADGVISHTFRWFIAETHHVHYSFNVYRVNGDTVTGRGLHFNRDFENFEDAPWDMRAINITSTQFELECISGCEGWIVNYQRLEDGGLLEQWHRPDGAEKSGPRIYYRRLNGGTGKYRE